MIGIESAGAGSVTKTIAKLRAARTEQVTLAISKLGTGTGLVTTVPAGIECGTVCSGHFALGTTVELLAHQAAGSTFDAYSTNCTRVGSKNLPPGPALCEIVLSGDRSVKAIFNLTSTSCAVPMVKGKTLAKAKFLLALRGCQVGTIKRVSSRKVKSGRVISQFPRAGSQGTHALGVNLVVSKGLRRAP
jgi:hypothetical protein